MSEKGDNDAGTKNYRKANLKGKDLRGKDLKNADLRKAKLKGADLSGADLSGADLSGADLSGTTLVDVKAFGTKWVGASFDKTVIKNLRTERADFSKASFRQCEIYGWHDIESVFKGVSFSKCVVKNGIFTSSSFTETEFFRGRFEECRFTECDLSALKAPAARMEKCHFLDCRFPKADLLSLHVTASEMKGCDFQAADLAGLLSVESRWEDCDFTRAELTTAEFRESVLSSGRYSRANFRYVAGLPPETMEQIKEGGGKVSRYLLRRFLKWGFSTRTGRVIFGVTLVIAIIMGNHYIQDPKRWSAGKLWTRVQQAEQGDRLEDAIAYYEALIGKIDDKDDQMTGAWIGLARVKMRLGREAEADAVLDEVLADKLILPDERIQALALRSEMDIHGGRYERILSIARDMVEVAPTPESLMNGLNHLCGLLVPPERTQLILEIIAGALEKYESDPALKIDLMMLRAQSMTGSKQPEIAIADYEALEAMSLGDERMQFVLMGLGAAYRNKGDLEKSRAYFNKLSTLFPDGGENVLHARMDEAQALRAMLKLDESEKILRQVLRDAPPGDIKAQAVNALANLLMELRRPDEAESLLQGNLKNLEADSAHWVEAKIHLAHVFHRRGDSDAAIALLTELLDRKIDRTFEQWARGARMEFYAESEKLDEAIEDARVLMKSSSDVRVRGHHTLFLAQLYVRTSRLPKALEILDPLKKDPTPPDLVQDAYQKTLEVLLRMGDTKRALAEARKMDQDAPSLNQKLAAKIHRVEIHYENNDFDKAVLVLEEILAMDPLPERLPMNAMRLAGFYRSEKTGELVGKIFVRFELRLKEGPDPYAYWLTRITAGHLLRELGEFEAARERYQTALENAVEQDLRMQAAESLGQLFFGNDMMDEAIQIYKSMETLWPRQPDARVMGLIGLSEIARRRNDNEEAETLLAQGISLCRDSNVCCRVLSGQVQNFRESDKPEKMKQVYRLVLEKHQDCWLVEEAKEAMGG